MQLVLCGLYGFKKFWGRGKETGESVEKIKHSIKVKNVSKEMEEETVLSSINMTMESGKVYGLIGRNGSGKSMLLRIMSGLVKPSEGIIEFDGKQLYKDMEVEANLGVIIENEEMYPEFTGLQNLSFLAQIRNKIGKIEIKEAMEKIGLNSKDKRLYKKYSLGMRQKLAIAQAIMENPNFLLLDEPTNGLDPESVQLLHQIILEEKEKGTIVLLASHSIKDIKALCDETYKMENGKLSFMEK